MSYDSALVRLDEAASALSQAARMRLGTNVDPRGVAERADAALRAALRELPRGDRAGALIQQARTYLRPYAGLGQLPGPLGPAFGVPKMPSGPTTARMPQGVALPGVTMQTRTVGPQFSAARQLVAAARQLVAAKVRGEGLSGLGTEVSAKLVALLLFGSLGVLLWVNAGE